MEKYSIVDIDINSGSLHRSFANQMIGGGDEAGNRYGLRLMNNGEPVSMSGASCIGYFIRSDGETLVINGTVSNGVAYVELPAAAYAKEGQFSLAIKVTGTGFANTMRIVDGTVVKTTTDNMYDPASEIPSLESLMAVIERAEAAAETIDDLSITATQITGTRYKIAVIKET